MQRLASLACALQDSTRQFSIGSQETLQRSFALFYAAAAIKLELVGGKCPQVDVRSLVSVFRGREEEVRERLHFEHAVCYSKEQAFQALTDGHTKYIWRPEGGSEQLFDLDKDPREEHDLANDNVPLLHEWRSQMVRQLVGRPEGFSDGTQLIAGRPYPLLQARARK